MYIIIMFIFPSHKIFRFRLFFIIGAIYALGITAITLLWL